MVNKACPTLKSLEFNPLIFLSSSTVRLYNFETEKSENYILATKAICDKIGIKQYHMSMTDFVDHVDLPELSNNEPVTEHDSSTNGLINQYKQWKA